ncbi:DMT family transporter [Iodidimonas sp. SYSU 1G8]|uniref:DMT family transporter n=1 Tax=Iodidimonas sp. SYSU 1G8 TaxID=3133967 RepID=UPI0031FEF053
MTTEAATIDTFIKSGKPQRRPWRRHLWHAALLLGLASMWGSSFLMVDAALKDFTPLATTAGRLAIAAGFFTIALFIRRRQVEKKKRAWGLMIGMALLGNLIPFFLINWGQQSVETGTAAILMGVVPLVTAVLAQVLVRGERFHLWKGIGIAIGFAGVVVLFGGPQISGGREMMLGAGAILIAALGYACGNILAEKVSDYHSLAIGFGVMWIATLVAVPIWFVTDGAVPQSPSLQAIGAVVALGIFCTAIPTLLVIYLVRSAGPTFASFTNYLVPVIGVALGIVFLHEPLTMNAIIALGLIIGGIVIGQIGGRRGKKTA